MTTDKDGAGPLLQLKLRSASHGGGAAAASNMAAANVHQELPCWPSVTRASVAPQLQLGWTRRHDEPGVLTGLDTEPNDDLDQCTTPSPPARLLFNQTLQLPNPATFFQGPRVNAATAAAPQPFPAAPAQPETRTRPLPLASKRIQPPQVSHGSVLWALQTQAVDPAATTLPDFHQASLHHPEHHPQPQQQDHHTNAPLTQQARTAWPDAHTGTDARQQAQRQALRQHGGSPPDSHSHLNYHRDDDSQLVILGWSPSQHEDTSAATLFPRGAFSTISLHDRPRKQGLPALPQYNHHHHHQHNKPQPACPPSPPCTKPLQTRLSHPVGSALQQQHHHHTHAAAALPCARPPTFRSTGGSARLASPYSASLPAAAPPPHSSHHQRHRDAAAAAAMPLQPRSSVGLSPPRFGLPGRTVAGPGLGYYSSINSGTSVDLTTMVTTRGTPLDSQADECCNTKQHLQLQQQQQPQPQPARAQLQQQQQATAMQRLTQRVSAVGSNNALLPPPPLALPPSPQPLQQHQQQLASVFACARGWPLSSTRPSAAAAAAGAATTAAVLAPRNSGGSSSRALFPSSRRHTADGAPAPGSADSRAGATGLPGWSAHGIGGGGSPWKRPAGGHAHPGAPAMSTPGASPYSSCLTVEGAGQVPCRDAVTEYGRALFRAFGGAGGGGAAGGGGVGGGVGGPGSSAASPPGGAASASHTGGNQPQQLYRLSGSVSPSPQLQHLARPHAPLWDEAALLAAAAAGGIGPGPALGGGGRGGVGGEGVAFGAGRVSMTSQGLTSGEATPPRSKPLQPTIARRSTARFGLSVSSIDLQEAVKACLGHRHLPSPSAASLATPLIDLDVSALNVSQVERDLLGLVIIGRGGGGLVFSATWQGAQVAVKFMLSKTPVSVNSSALEAVLAASVNHPFVVQTYGFDLTRIDESSLQQAPASQGPETPSPASCLVADIMQGLQRERERAMQGPQSPEPQASPPSPLSPNEPQASLPSFSQPPPQSEEQVGGGGGGGRDNAGKGNGGMATPRGSVHSPASSFDSEEGFGEPELPASRWSVSQVLASLHARPGMFLTHIIMEFCDRGTLLSALQRGVFGVGGTSGDVARFNERVVLRAALRTARDVARGMQHIHACDIIHGDLKPGNVLLKGSRTDRRGFVAKVADFGLSKVVLDDSFLEMHHWSTVTHMAPEVIHGTWCKQSDVYSFGVLLWQLMCGEPHPFKQMTVKQVVTGVSKGTLRLAWPPHCHPAVTKLGEACLAYDATLRPSFQEIGDVLVQVEQNVRNELRWKARRVTG